MQGSESWVADGVENGDSCVLHRLLAGKFGTIGGPPLFLSEGRERHAAQAVQRERGVFAGGVMLPAKPVPFLV